jgi:hypothetical protein
MLLKPGVRVYGIRPEMVLALVAADRIWQRHGSELVVTSVMDGTHSRGSLHYAGCAVDLRTWHLDDIAAAAQELREALGEDFDVVVEASHVHLEYQAKAAY